MKVISLWIAVLAIFTSITAFTQSSNQLCSVVSITRYYTDQERVNLRTSSYGVRGTAWFFHSSRYVVTAEHVIASPELSMTNWTTFEFYRTGAIDKAVSVSVRLYRVVETSWKREKLAILELKEPFPDTVPFSVRTESLVTNVPISSLGYPNEATLSTVAGTYYGLASESVEFQRFSGALLFEMYKENDRHSFGHGASGSPIFDANSKVVGVVGDIIASDASFGDKIITLPTPWGYPTHAVIPVENLSSVTFPRSD